MSPSDKLLDTIRRWLPADPLWAANALAPDLTARLTWHVHVLENGAPNLQLARWRLAADQVRLEAGVQGPEARLRALTQALALALHMGVHVLRAHLSKEDLLDYCDWLQSGATSSDSSDSPEVTHSERSSIYSDLHDMSRAFDDLELLGGNINFLVASLGPRNWRDAR